MRNSILLIGYFGYQNLGDDLILFSFLQNFKGFDIVVLTKKKYKNIFYKQISRYNFFLVAFYLFFNNSVILFPGGEIFQEKSSKRSVLFYSFFCFLAIFFKRNYYLLFQGIDKNIKTALNKKILKKVFSNSKLLIQRDSLNIDSSFDIVFSMDISKYNKIEEENFFLFSLKNMDNDTFIILKSVFVLLINEYSKCHFIFLPFDRKKDYEINRKMVSLLDSFNVSFEDWNNNIDIALSYIKKSKFIFSMRYHSSILAFLFEKNNLAFTDDEKILNLYKAVGSKDVYDYSNGCDYEKIYSAIKQSIKNKSKINLEKIKKINRNKIRKAKSFLLSEFL